MLLKKIAELVDGTIQGKTDIEITSVAQLDDALEGQLAFFANPKYSGLLKNTKASAILVKDGEIFPGIKSSLLYVNDVYLALSKIIGILNPPMREIIKGIDKACVIGKGAILGKDIAIGANVVIGEKVLIGDNTEIQPNSYIGPLCKIGSDVLIYPNVTIMHNVIIGNRVIIHAGSVIGSDGYGYATAGGKHYKIPQVGKVIIEDDVEIGANVAIDRAAIGGTVIGAGTKIDNLVMIAHNVKIGKNCLIVAQTGISGSTVIGNNVVLAGQSGVVGHITIGDNVIVGAQAGVTKNINAGQVVSGYPARNHKEAKLINAQLSRLKKLFDDVEEIKKQLER
jgi:UDP-3-O-[3-hydroxymyristoyl] glucosamine N-acyltransferase